MVAEYANLTIPGLIERAAARFGDRIAYVQGDSRRGRTLTWSAVAKLVRETAAGLVALGVERGDRVAICAENSIDWLIAYLAAASAGASGVLVYHELKAAEIREQVTRPGCMLLFTSESVLARLPDGLGVETIVQLEAPAAPRDGCLTLEGVAAAATDASRAALATRQPAQDDLAAIVYTSGTTGGAKGVMLTHRNFVSNAVAVTKRLPLSEADSVLLVLPLHHAMPFIATLVLVPLLGARVVLENDLRRLRDRLQEQQPTVFFGVPALFDLMYRNIVARAESEGRLATFEKARKVVVAVKRLTGVNLGPLLFRPVHHALGGGLRFLVCGGAALNPRTAADFFALGLPLLQGWGMTEASPVVAIQGFSQRRFLLSRYYERHAGSVGLALDGVEVRLIDVPDKGISVAGSGEGEVIVRGPNVFAGYWQAPELTQAAVPDGWLRTGDLGRIDGAGNIYLTGRSKYIIVLDSGEKVYPDEIEAKLAESALIADVCVTQREARGKPIVAAVVYPAVEALKARAASDGVELDAAYVRRSIEGEAERLGKELAAYKRVTSVELSDAPLPKTALRKVARGLLAPSYEFDLARWLASVEA